MPTPKTLLALDTSGPWLQLALFQDGQEEIFCEDISRGHAEILFERLEGFLGAHGVAYQDLEALAVTTGPGSFTGLRIGIAAARGLGLALKIGVIGVPNLLALSLGKRGGPFSIVLDARRDQFYLQDFQAPGSPLTPPRLISRETALERGFSIEKENLDNPKIDIAGLARFALTAEPAAFAPQPTYVRPADAKPQTKARIARQD